MDILGAAVKTGVTSMVRAKTSCGRSHMFRRMFSFGSMELGKALLLLTGRIFMGTRTTLYGTRCLMFAAAHFGVRPRVGDIVFLVTGMREKSRVIELNLEPI